MMELDQTKTEGKARLPKSKRRIAERKDLYQQMQRIGNVSMIPLGPNTFRTTNRGERRRRGIRKQTSAVLAVIAQKKGTTILKRQHLKTGGS
jgi:hypothetical protein